jgi:hypothetical protein
MLLAGFLLASIASKAALTSGQLAASNASVAQLHVPSNSTRAGHTDGTVCSMPRNSVPLWWYNTRTNGPYDFYSDTSGYWAMLNAYRAGGAQNVHWKYTDNVNDPECLNWWEYYAEDGRTLIAKIGGRTTKLGDTRSWCAMPVYRSGGVQGKQWEYCICWYEGLPVHP